MAMLHGWTFCPRCAGTLRAAESRVECGDCGYLVYANPAPTASALVVDGEGRILLARRSAEVEDGKWDLPGGFLEEGEHPVGALMRELREETGLEIELLRFFGFWTDWYGAGPDAPSTLNLYWVARIVKGQPRAADDVSELRWFARGALPPPDEIAFSNVREVLTAWRDEDA